MMTMMMVLSPFGLWTTQRRILLCTNPFDPTEQRTMVSGNMKERNCISLWHLYTCVRMYVYMY